MGILLYDTIEKVLNRNNLLPSRVEFLKRILIVREWQQRKFQEGLKSMRIFKRARRNLKDNP